ncbi:putative FraH protein [Candidatus Terasakiella magnetica]|nr:putative FraH protein [Candidatus Terasakiella magnetica]
MATNRRNRTKGASDDKVRGDVGNDVTPSLVESQPTAPVVKPKEGGLWATLLKSSPWSSNSAASQVEEPAAPVEPVSVNPLEPAPVTDLVTRWSQPIWRVPSQVQADGDPVQLGTDETVEDTEAHEPEPTERQSDDKVPDVSDETIDVQAEPQAEPEGIPDGSEGAHELPPDADAEPTPDHEVVEIDIADGIEPEPEVAQDNAMTEREGDDEMIPVHSEVEIGPEPETITASAAVEAEPELGAADAVVGPEAFPMPDIDAPEVEVSMPAEEIEAPQLLAEQAVISDAVEDDAGAAPHESLVKAVPVEDLLTGIFNVANSAVRDVINASSDLVKNRNSVASQMTAHGQKLIQSIKNRCGIRPAQNCDAGSKVGE